MRTLISIALLFAFMTIKAQDSLLSTPDSLHQIGMNYQAQNNHIMAVYYFTKEAEYYYFERDLTKTRSVIDEVIHAYPQDADSSFAGYSQMLKLRAITFAIQDKNIETTEGFNRQLRHLLSYPSDSNDLATAYRNTAQAYFNLKDSRGIQDINKAIEINKALDNNQNIIDNYLAIVSYLTNIDLSEMANRYLDHCEALFEEYELEDYELLAYIYKKKGINYSISEDYDNSLYWVEKSYQTYIQYKIDDIDIVNTAGNVALEAKSKKDYKLAKKYGKITLELANKYYAPESTMHATSYLVLGEIYALEKQNDSADYFLDKCIDIYIKEIGPNYGHLSTPYHHKATVQENLGNYLQAAMYYQKSLYTNFGQAEKLDSTLTTSPNLDDEYFSFDALKFATSGKTKNIYRYYQEKGETKYLDLTIENIKKSDSLEWVFTNRRTMSLEENIIQFKEYEETLDLMATIANDNPDPAYVELGFQMLNNQKAGYLDASLNKNKESSNTVSVSLLGSKIRDIQQQIIKAEEGYSQLDKLSLENKNKLLNEICELYLAKLETKNQINEQAKEKGETYAFENIDIQRTIELTKNTNTAVIDYFYLQQKLYIYLINEKGLKLKVVEIDKDFESLILSFKKAIKTQSKERYQIGNQLSELLLKPILPEIATNQKVVIIPFGMLSEIPFDLLPIDQEGKMAVEKYAISYHYSTKLWLQSTKRIKPSKYNLLAIAPVFQKKAEIEINDYPEFAMDSISNQEIVYRGSSLKPLPHSIKEIKNLTKICKTYDINITTLTYSAANANDFLIHAPQSNIIHIATHGTASKHNPYKTGLFFYIPEGEDSDDHFLSVYDLSYLDISADLVVLSACKTGSGQLAEGEGVIALPRAFVNSGVPNVLASLWKIHDEKTKFLMTSFYTYLAQGDAYAIALQKAKLDCIHKGYIELDWAGFILIGQ